MRDNFLYFVTLLFCSIILRLQGQAVDRHERRTAEICRRICVRMSLPELATIAIVRAARLHDIGKITVPDVLIHSPATLGEMDWIEMQAHSKIGARILDKLGFDRVITGAVLHHHSNYDGTGYPDHIRMGAIPLGARIIRIADTYDGITSNRPYRLARTHEEAMMIMRGEVGKSLDPDIFTVFAEIIK